MSLRIIVTGLIAQYPLGGVAWDYVQYLVGFHRLGHDVYYVEDTGQWPYSPSAQALTDDPSFNLRYLADVLDGFGLAGRWAYRFPRTGEWFGMEDGMRSEVLDTADLLLNVSGTLARPWEYRRPSGRLAFIDTDPVFTQVKIARGQLELRRAVDAHDVHLSFGERLGAGVPSTGHRWRPTRQPIVVDEWDSPGSEPREVFTTVMNWTSYNSVTYAGVTYGQKDVEFHHFLDLPSAVQPVQLEVAMSPGRTRRSPMQLLRHRGWRMVDPALVCPDPGSYRRYVQGSKGEWSVAKQGYVVSRCGWFSCRSACYLASGRPVIVQDTGFSEVIPSGRGVLAFSTLEEARSAILEVDSDYALHARAAREIARTYFGSDVVLGGLLADAFA